MSYSKAQIFNLALNNLGISATIQNTDNQSDTLNIILNNYYDIAKEHVLKNHDWGFASRYRSLAKSTTNSPIHPKFKYQYDYPNDCLFIRSVINSVGKNIEYEIASNSDGQKIIFTNEQGVNIRYTANVDKETFFSSEFVIALTWYLAFLSSSAISGSNEDKNNCLKVYESVVLNAKSLDANESYCSEESNHNWLDER